MHFVLAKYAPLRNDIYLEIPKPTPIIREVDKYDFNSFGASIEVGFSRRDITPSEKGISWIAGYFPPHFRRRVNDPIWVKSLALRDKAGNGIVIVSCDFIGLLPDEIENIKKLVKSADPRSILISTTHTHSGPDVVGLWGIPPFGGKNKKYMEFMRTEIAKTIEESISNLGPGKIRFGSGEFKGYSHGRTDNDPDYGVSVIQVLRKSGQPVTLVNFALHADVIKNLSLSADFPYFLEERLRKFSGGDVIFIPGAIGGVQPHRGDGSFDAVRKIGEDLADRVYEILKSPISSQDVLISGKVMNLNFQVQNKLFIRAAKIGMISEFFDSNGSPVKVKYNGKDIDLDSHRVDIGFSMFRIGPAQLLTVPGELFPNIWAEVKKEMDGSPKFLFGLTGGELGYILSREDFESGNHKYHAGMSPSSSFGDSSKRTLLMLLGK